MSMSDWCRHLANWTKHRPTGRLWLWLIPYVLWKHDVIHKTGSTLRFALSLEEGRATATCNMYRTFREIWTVAFEIRRRTDKQTHTHTDTRITILCIRVGGEVTTGRCSENSYSSKTGRNNHVWNDICSML